MNSYTTIMTREGVSDPSRLSPKGQAEHYSNRNGPRRLQAVNRARKAAGKPVIHPGDERY